LLQKRGNPQIIIMALANPFYSPLKYFSLMQNNKKKKKGKIETYRWTGINEQFMYSDLEKIAIGGGYFL